MNNQIKTLLNFLDDHIGVRSEILEDRIERNKTIIIETLAKNKIGVSEISAIGGPAVTLYRIIPAPGCRISSVKRFADIIAIALGSECVRVVVFEDAIDLEVAYEEPGIIPLKTALNSQQFSEKCTRLELPVALGSTVTNEPYIFDLTSSPHLLIAGAPDTGKSTALHVIITSLLISKQPSEVQFVLIDSKKGEFTSYRNLKGHYLAGLPGTEDRIITDSQTAVKVIQSLCGEMESRYDLLVKSGTRKITDYNEKLTNNKLDPAKGHRYLPYIVVVIDEFSDLMMDAGNTFESPLVYLAQRARAVGIHLVIATNHPTNKIITGNIKANFNARIAFKVDSIENSKNIIDAAGAERLLSRGDMLVLYPGNELTRVQGATIGALEIQRITMFISEQEVPVPDMTNLTSTIRRINSVFIKAGERAPKSRLEYNRDILKKLKELIENNPDLRFGQIIANYVLSDYREKDMFFEESEETAHRLEIDLPQ